MSKVLFCLFALQAVHGADRLFRKGERLNTLMRINSASPVAFLEKHGITVADLVATFDTQNAKNKELGHLLNTLKPADLPYVFFYTNEFMFDQRFPGILGIKINNPTLLALTRIGIENGGSASGPKLRNRFYVLQREGMAVEVLPDGLLFLPETEAKSFQELKSLQSLHDSISGAMSVTADANAFVEYYEQNNFADISERFRVLFKGKASSGQNFALNKTNSVIAEKVLMRLQKNPFFRAVMETKSVALKMDLTDGLVVQSEYTLGEIKHKDAFVKTLSSLQVLGSVASTFALAAFDLQVGQPAAVSENMRIGLDLFTKFAESFEKIRITDHDEKVRLHWQFIGGKDVVPAMQLAKKIVEEKKADQRLVERIEALRDEICLIQKEGDKARFAAKIREYAAALPADEAKIWRVKQSCPDGLSLLMHALKFGGEDVFLTLTAKLKHYMGFAPVLDAEGSTYLHIAVKMSYPRAIKKILADAMPSGTADNSGKTALIYAIEAKNSEFVKVMLDHGFQIMSDDDVTLAKKTLRAAEASGDEKILRLVEEAHKREKARRVKRQTQS